MEITKKLHTTTREQWRDWLAENHSTKREIWISTTKNPDGLQYLDAVEEALCFGWIDSTIKAGEGVMWRRFSPRRKRSPWTELNKERCRRLERLGLMTDAGWAVLPNMDFQIDDDVLATLQSDKIVWQNFQSLPSSLCASTHQQHSKYPQAKSRGFSTPSSKVYRVHSQLHYVRRVAWRWSTTCWRVMCDYGRLF